MLTIGNFDGLHLGHRALINRVLDTARRFSVPSVVMTFEPHPVKVLYPDRKLHRIFDFEDQRARLEEMGVDALVVEPFSREFSQLPPERYLLEWIYRPFVPKAVIVGYDFSFGANRQGTIDFLKSHAGSLGFEVEVVSPVKVGDVLVSSSRIRQALNEGDVALAGELLGRSFYLSGLIERGAGRGRTIGIPTANLRTAAETLPARGVYCGHVHVRGAWHDAVVNIGLNPTFNEGAGSGQPLHIEAHLLNFQGDLYGEKMTIDFVQRLRDERKFSSVSELVTQIHRDIQDGERILHGK